MRTQSHAPVLLALLALLLASPVQAALIKPDFIAGVTAVNSQPPFSSSFDIGLVVDNSGMSDAGDPGDPAATHLALNQDQYVSAAISPAMVTDFTLPSTFRLSHIVIWNGHQGFATNRGINDVEILTSTDGGVSLVSHGMISVGEATLVALGSGGPDHIEALAANANFVRFDITSNHGDPTFVSLREVRFYGTLVPEPSTAILLGLGLVGVASLSGRRTGRR